MNNEEQMDIAMQAAYEVASEGGPTAREAFRLVKEKAPDYLLVFVISAMTMVDLHPYGMVQQADFRGLDLEDAFVAEWNDEPAVV